jgi:hypothetical protein
MSWAAVAAAVVGLYSANKASKDAKERSKEAASLYDPQRALLKQLSPYAIDYYKKSREAYEPAFANNAALAGGDRARIMSAVAPDLQNIGNKYQSIIGASRELNPRGGASASYNTDLAFRAGDEQQALLSGARSNAFGNLAKMAGLAGDLGAGAAGNATQAGAGASGMLSNINQMNAMSAMQQQQAYGQVGAALQQAFSDWQRNRGSATGSGSGSAPSGAAGAGWGASGVNP